eukprot:g3838.t1
MSSKASLDENMLVSDTLIGSPSAGEIRSAETAKPSRLFSKISQARNCGVDITKPSQKFTALPNPMNGTTLYSCPAGDQDDSHPSRRGVVGVSTTTVPTPIELVLRVRPMRTPTSDENLIMVHQSSTGLTLRAPAGGINTLSTRKKYGPTGQVRVGAGTPWRTPLRPKPKSFQFDAVVGSGLSRDLSQNLMYAKVKPLVNSFLDGFNATVLAYGATGTGKTYTIMGNPDCSGILPRMVSDLFAKIKEHASANMAYEVSIGYVELYNNRFQDLLYSDSKDLFQDNTRRSAPGKHSNVAIELHDNGVDGMTLTGSPSLRTPVTSAEDAILQIRKGKKERHSNAKSSSRSHAIVTFYLTKSLHDKTVVSRSKFHIIDLAGSDRLSVTSTSGEELKERQAINLSLSCLSNVLMTLSNAKSDVWLAPYRDSKLTYLLKDSLGGNSKTLFIAHVNPASEHYRETLTTLEYATKARKIQNLARHSHLVVPDCNTDDRGFNSSINSSKNYDLMSNTQSAILREKLRQINYLQQQVHERNRQVKTLEENNISACNEANSLKSAIENLNKKYDVERKSLSDQINAMKTGSNPNLQKEVEELRERLLVSETNHAEEKATLESKIQYIEARAMHEAEVIDDLRADLDRSRTHLVERIKQLAHSRAVAVLEAEGKCLDAEIDSLHYQNDCRKTRLDAIRARDQRDEKSKQQLGIIKQRENLANLARKLVQQVQDHRVYIEHVENMAEKAIRKVQKQKQKKSLYIESIQAIEMEKETWEKKYEKAQKEIVKLKKKLTIKNNRKKGMYGSNLNKRQVFSEDIDNASIVEKPNIENSENQTQNGAGPGLRKRKRKLRSNNTTLSASVEATGIGHDVSPAIKVAKGDDTRTVSV